MLKFNQILCPVDLSSIEHPNIDYAVKLSNAESTITIFSVLEIPYLVDPNGFNYYTEMATHLKNSINQNMNDLIQSLKGKFPSVAFQPKIVELVDPTDAIIQESKRMHADIIVINSHGRRGLKRVLMGSIAESVMRHSECPVIIIKI